MDYGEVLGKAWKIIWKFKILLIVSGLVFLVYLPIWLVLAGAVRSYPGAAWTLTFRRLTGRGSLPAPVPPQFIPTEPLPPAE